MNKKSVNKIISLFLFTLLTVNLCACTGSSKDKNSTNANASVENTTDNNTSKTSDDNSTSTNNKNTKTTVEKEDTKSDINLEDSAREFIKLFMSEDYEKASENFNATMKKSANPESLKQIRASIITQFGTIKEEINLKKETKQGFTSITITSKFENGYLDLIVNFNSDNEIAGFLLNTPELKSNENDKKNASDSDIKFENLSREFIKQFVSEDFEKAHEKFDDTMKKTIPIEGLKNVKSDLESLLGKIQEEIESKKETKDNKLIITLTHKTENGYLNFTFVYNENNQIMGLRCAPAQINSNDEPTNSSILEKEITIGSDQWKLPGTLTLPNTEGPFPAVILVHGSGPNDRDESGYSYKPFKDIANGLTSQGIAVLRYDKRNKVHKMPNSYTVQDLVVDDVLSAFELLKNRKEIDSNRIFILGHSLGGLLIPKIGEQIPDAAGLISLAGSTRPLYDVILDQSKYFISIDDQTSIDKKKESLKAAEEYRNNTKALKFSDNPAENPLGHPANFWIDFYNNYAPAETAKKLQQPMFIIQGEKDFQVFMKDFNLWKEVLASKKNVEYKSYPELNHFFIKSESGTLGEYTIPGHVSEEVIDDLSNWIKKQ